MGRPVTSNFHLYYIGSQGRGDVAWEDEAWNTTQRVMLNSDFVNAFAALYMQQTMQVTTISLPNSICSSKQWQ